MWYVAVGVARRVHRVCVQGKAVLGNVAVGGGRGGA